MRDTWWTASRSAPLRKRRTKGCRRSRQQSRADGRRRLKPQSPESRCLASAPPRQAGQSCRPLQRTYLKKSPGAKPRGPPRTPRPRPAAAAATLRRPPQAGQRKSSEWHPRRLVPTGMGRTTALSRPGATPLRSKGAELSIQCFALTCYIYLFIYFVCLFHLKRTTMNII